MLDPETMKVVYYAHCMALYGTPQELRDVQLLEDLGFYVFNPNSVEVEDICRTIKRDWRALRCGESDGHLTLERRAELAPFEEDSAAIMSLVFKPLATFKSDVLAFRALPDGRVPAGVAQEVAWAREYGNPVIELPSNLMSRGMTVEQTREYLREIGQR